VLQIAKNSGFDDGVVVDRMSQGIGSVMAKPVRPPRPRRCHRGQGRFAGL